eukprot:UN01684
MTVPPVPEESIHDVPDIPRESIHNLPEVPQHSIHNLPDVPEQSIHNSNLPDVPDFAVSPRRQTNARNSLSDPELPTKKISNAKSDDSGLGLTESDISESDYYNEKGLQKDNLPQDHRGPKLGRITSMKKAWTSFSFLTPL